MAQGAPITRIVNTRRLKVRFTIPGKYSAYIKPGQTLTVRTSTQEHQGVATVYALDPAIQTTSRTLEVRAHLDNPTGLFMAGDFAEISIGLAQQPKTILIPPEAIVPELNRQIVFVVVDGIAHRREVKTGAHTRDSIEITEGLRDGDKVVLTGLMTLKEGANVEVRTEEKEDRK
jgi:membrane fusion protein (multidrug efflux system)